MQIKLEKTDLKIEQYEPLFYKDMFKYLINNTIHMPTPQLPLYNLIYESAIKNNLQLIAFNILESFFRYYQSRMMNNRFEYIYKNDGWKPEEITLDFSSRLYNDFFDNSVNNVLNDLLIDPLRLLINSTVQDNIKIKINAEQTFLSSSNAEATLHNLINSSAAFNIRRFENMNKKMNKVIKLNHFSLSSGITLVPTIINKLKNSKDFNEETLTEITHVIPFLKQFTNHHIYIYKNIKIQKQGTDAIEIEEYYIFTNKYADYIQYVFNLIGVLPLLLDVKAFKDPEVTIDLYKMLTKVKTEKTTTENPIPKSIMDCYISIFKYFSTKTPNIVRLEAKKNLENTIKTYGENIIHDLKEVEKSTKSRYIAYSNELIQAEKEYFLAAAALNGAYSTNMEYKNLLETLEILNENTNITVSIAADNENDKLKQYLLVNVISQLIDYEKNNIINYLRNKDSMLFYNFYTFIAQRDFSLKNKELVAIVFYYKLFIEQSFKIYTNTTIGINLQTGSIMPIQILMNQRNVDTEYTYTLNTTVSKFSNQINFKEKYEKLKGIIIPHIHVNYYDCWSSNKAEMKKQLENKNYQMAMDIFLATTQNINSNDTAVMGNLILAILRVGGVEYKNRHITSTELIPLLNYEIFVNQTEKVWELLEDPIFEKIAIAHNLVPAIKDLEQKYKEKSAPVATITSDIKLDTTTNRYQTPSSTLNVDDRIFIPEETNFEAVFDDDAIDINLDDDDDGFDDNDFDFEDED